jgi:hypothetical protein
MIETAMQHVMYDTGTPIANSVSRTACVHFRPKQANDATFLTIVYGEGCSAHVNKNFLYKIKSFLILTGI